MQQQYKNYTIKPSEDLQGYDVIPPSGNGTWEWFRTIQEAKEWIDNVITFQGRL